ncbi:hypothetical protein [Vibrio phage vB_pir03]|nr:hypothetical protein [Vibrio phage vB_pir03]
MFNKKQIVEKVQELKAKFPGIEPVLLHGTSMVMHGVKETTNDIDCYVEDVVLVLGDALSRREDTYVSNGVTHTTTRYEIGDFDFGFGWKQTPEVVYIDGLAVQSLEQIVEEKKVWDRPKDKVALQQIHDYLVTAEIAKIENPFTVIDSLTSKSVDEIGLVEDDEEVELVDNQIKEELMADRSVKFERTKPHVNIGVGKVRTTRHLDTAITASVIAEGFGTDCYPEWQAIGGDYDGNSTVTIRHRDTKPKRSKAVIRKQRKVRKAARKTNRRGK